MLTRLGLNCLSALPLLFAASCSSGIAPHAQISAAGTVATDDPLLVPPGLTERPGTPGDRAAGEVGGGTRAFR